MFVVVLSPNAAESPWVKEETQLALREAITSGRRLVIPVLYQKCNMDLISPLLASRRVIDIAEKPIAHRFRDCLKATHDSFILM